MKKCMKFIKTALLLCALLLTVTAITAKAEESYGFRVTRSVPNPEIGTEVTITFELTDYDETKTGIRGLQVDLAGLDPQILEVVSAASLVADDGAMTNEVVYEEQEQTARYLFIKEEGILDRQNSELFEIVLRINPDLTEGGTVDLPLTCKIQTQDGPCTLESAASVKYRTIGAPVEVESIAFDKAELNLFTQESLNTETLSVLYTPWDANTGLKVAWSSSDEAVATVEDGMVTAVGAGTAVITAETVAGQKAECQVRVTGLNKTSLDLDLDGEEELWVSDGDNELSAKWSISDESVASVSEYGKVFALAEGEAVITAVLEDGTALTCDLRVLDELCGISFQISETLLEVEKTKQLDVTFEPAQKAGELVWESSDETVVTVDNGLVKGLSVGTATVTAKAVTPSGKELTAKCDFEVVEKDLTEWADETLRLYAVTNVHHTLEDLSDQLPEGWQWVDPTISLNAFRGRMSKAFAVWHENPYVGETLYSTVTVDLTTIDDILLDGMPAKLATGADPQEAAVSYGYTGAVLTAQQEESLGLNWKFSIAPKAKTGIVEVSGEENKLAVSGLKTGSTKILVQLLAGEIELVSKQISVAVVDGSKGIARIQAQLVDADGQAFSQGSDDAYVVPSGGTIWLKNVTEAGPDGKEYKITYKSSDTSVIKLGKADKTDKSKTALIAGKPGYAFITATANDALKTSVKIAVKVTDNTASGISLGNSAVTINQLWETAEAEVIVYNGHDSVLESVEVMKDKAASVPTDAFSVEKDEENPNKLIVTCGSASKSGTVYLKIRTVGMEGEAAVLPLKVNLVSKSPTVVIKQSQKLNTFYKDSYGMISVGASGERISDVHIKEEDCGYEYDYAAGKISVKDGGDISDKTCTFVIKVEGYKDPVEKKVKIATETVNIALESSGGTVYPGTKNMTVRTRLLDKSTKKALDLDKAQVAALDKNGNAVKEVLVRTDGDELLITALSTPEKKLSLQLHVTGDGWNESRTFSYSINVKAADKAALKLEKKALTLYHYTAASGVYGECAVGTGLTLDGLNTAKMLENVIIAGKDAKSQSALGETLNVYYEKESGRIMAAVLGEGPDAGTYKFRISLDDASLSKTISADLSVKVVKVPQMNGMLNLGAKGKIDVLNREGTSITITPKFKNLADGADVLKAELTGADAHLFEIRSVKNGVLTVHLKENVNVVTKYDYRIGAIYTVQSGTAVLSLESAPVKVKLTQGKAKSSVVGIGAYGNTAEETYALDFIVSNSVGEKLDIQHVELMNYTGDFVFNEETGELAHRMRGETARGKKYKLKFNIYLSARGDNEKPVTAEYTLVIPK